MAEERNPRPAQNFLNQDDQFIVDVGRNAKSDFDALPPLERAILAAGGYKPPTPEPATPAPEPAPSQPSILGEFGRGVRRGVSDIGSLGIAAGGVAAEAFGAEETSKELIDLAISRQEAIREELPATVPFEEIVDSPGSFVRFAASALGENVPVLATIMLGGGVGTIAGRLLAKRAITKEGAERAVRRYATGGAIGAGTVIETGATGVEQAEATGDVNAPVAIGAGIAKGMLEGIVPLALGRAAGLFGSRADDFGVKVKEALEQIASRPGRAAAGAASGLAVESATELLQESIDVGARAYVDENFDALGPETSMRLLESAVTGAILGGVVGGVGGALTTHREQGEEIIQEGEQLPPALPGPLPALPAPEGVPLGTQATTETPSDQTIEAQAPIEPLLLPGPDQVVEPDIELEAIKMPKAPPDLTSEFLVVPATTSVQEIQGGNERPIFFSPEDASEQVAFEGARNVKLFSLSEAQKSRLDLTASLRSLPLFPEDLTANTSGVSFLDSKRKEEALRLAKRAIRARNQEQQVSMIAALRTTPPTFSTSFQIYRQAIDAGFRFEPTPGQGFILASGKVSDLTEVRVQDLETRIPEASDVGVFSPERIVPANGNLDAVIPIGPDALQSARASAIPQTLQRRFQLDLKRVPKNSLTTTSLLEAFTALDDTKPGSFDPQDLSQVRAALRILKARGQANFSGNVSGVARDLVDVFRQMDTEGPREQGKLRASEYNFLQLVRERGLRIRPALGVQDTGGLAFVGDIPFGAVREVPATPVHPQDRRPSSYLLDIFELDLYLAVEAPKVLNPKGATEGKEYKLADHKEGTAVGVIRSAQDQLSRTDARHFREIVAFYNALMKEFNIKGKLIVEVNPNEKAGINGVMRPYEGGVSKIGIKFDQHPERIARISTGSHEFGHFLFWEKISEASDAMIDQLISAYNRALIVANFGELPDFRKAFFPPVRFASPTLDFATTFSTAREAVSRETGEGTSYWFSFDEWAADQIARWVQTRNVLREPIDSLEKFFKHIGALVRKLFERSYQLMGFEKKDFREEPEIEDWLRSLRDRRNADIPSIMAARVGEKKPKYNKRSNISTTSQASTFNGAAAAEGIPLDRDMRQRMDEVKETSDYFNWIVKQGWNVLQLGQKNPHIVWLQNYIATVRRWYNTKMEWISRANGRVKQYNKMGKVEAENWSKFTFDVDQMTYRTADETRRGVIRKPTEQELVELAQKHHLTERGLQLYTDMRDDFDAILNDIERIIIQDIRRTMGEGVPTELEVGEIQKEFSLLRQRPYFPHSRFGDFAVVIKGRDGKVAFMEQFTSRNEARTAAKKLTRRFRASEGFTIGIDKIPETAQVFRGLPPSLLEMIRGKLKLSDEQRKWLDALIVDMAPSQSFRKRMQRREDIPGFSTDAIRSYANYFWHAGNHLARIEYGDEMQRIINDAATDTSQLRDQGFDVSKRRQILDFLQDHRENILNPGPDWAQARSFAFQYWLGFSPASALLNFTQVPLVAFPYLSNRFGEARAAKALQKGLTDIRKTYGSPERFINKLPEGDFKLLDLAIRQGFVDESQATELAGIAEGATLTRMRQGTKFQRELMRFAQMSSWMFQTSEKINRRVVFRAAIELARANPDAPHLQELRRVHDGEIRDIMRAEGISESEALAFIVGRDAVDRTQFEYAAWARPRFMRGRKGTVFTFFMFVQNMAWFTFNSPGNIRFLLMMLFMAGFMGLPGAEDISSIARFIGRKVFGVEFDVEKEARALMVEMFGENSTADLFLHGASREGFGLPAAFDAIGIPFPAFDMSANIGLGQIIPGAAELGPPSRDFNSSFSRVTTDVAGATFGIGINMLKFLSDTQLPIDDAKRWERAMPRAVRNVTRAVRFLEEERERSRTGATVLEFDPTDPTEMAEIIAQGLGLTPTRLSRKWDRDTALFEAEAMWTIRRGMLMQQYDHARVVKDREAIRDALDAIKRFNRTLPFKSLAITGSNLSRSVRERERRRRLREHGLPAQKSLIPVAREVDRLHPEVDVEDVTRKR